MPAIETESVNIGGEKLVFRRVRKDGALGQRMRPPACRVRSIPREVGIPASAS